MDDAINIARIASFLVKVRGQQVRFWKFGTDFRTYLLTEVIVSR